jgi:chaperonin GroEL (HSP60 family)
MEKSKNQRLREAILEVINIQTLTRLRNQGFSEEEALRLIGYVVAAEVFSVLKENRQYTLGKYIAALNDLPKLPWEKGK